MAEATEGGVFGGVNTGRGEAGGSTEAAGRGGAMGLKGVTGGGVPPAGLFVGFKGEDKGRFGGGGAIQIAYTRKINIVCIVLEKPK